MDRLPDSYTCQLCGSWVTDRVKHVDWHMAWDAIWRWIDRVSGSSCDTARGILDQSKEPPCPTS